MIVCDLTVARYSKSKEVIVGRLEVLLVIVDVVDPFRFKDIL